MLYPINNGSMVLVYPEPDAKPKECYLPPEGFGVNSEGKLKRITVHKRHTHTKECFWERDPRFAKCAKWKIEEEEKRKTDKNYTHPELDKFIDECWTYRDYGFWFSNNGIPTYITGDHWFFLSVIPMDKGDYADYRDTDRLLFYFWALCEEEPACLGILYITMRRDGKCLGLDTPIRMFDGSIKMVQDISEGDVVMGYNSQPRTAFGITKGREEMFEIIPHKGVPFSCNRSHILSLKYNGQNKNGWVKNQTVNISVNDYLNLSVWDKDHLCLYRTGWDTGISNEHIIPPYILGAWLGDGTALSGGMTIVDEEIKQAFRDYASSLGIVLKWNGENAYAMTPERRTSKENAWVAKLRALNLISNKHIPKSYILDSKENRLQLLAGLVDTDGHPVGGKTGRTRYYEITQKRKEIAYGIVEVARSAGFYVSIKEKIAVLKREGKEKYECLVYRISICGDIKQIPCKVKRKAVYHDLPKAEKNRTGFVIKPIGEGDYYGFGVDGDHLFLLGDGTVTHNTLKAGSIGLNKATKTPNFKFGIQSKNDKDAAKVFRKAIINPYKKFPFFFKLDDKNTNPTKESLTFSTPKIKYSEDDFDTLIDYRASDTYAYDGSALNYCLHDEVGKPQSAGVDINERLGVVEYCMKNNRSEIIGKMFVTSTVEEMGGGAKKLKKMWDDSDSTVITEEKKATTTQLWRYFKPAHEVLIYDKYGIVDVEVSLNKIMKEREGFKNDARRLAEKIRKQPTSVKEAFMTSTETCMFNPILLDDRESVLAWDKQTKYYTRGNFALVGEDWGDVKFVPNPNGEVYLVADIPDDLKNRRTSRFGYQAPMNSHIFSMGVDPYDLKTFITEDNKRDLSDGSFTIIKKPSETHPMDIDNGVICFFRHRYVDPFMFYKQTIMAALYFGCEALIERNRDGLLSYMEREGLQLFCTMLPNAKEGKRGIHANADTNGTIFELTDQYITEHIDKVNIAKLIEDWKGFDPSNTTKFDGAMSCGYALMQWDMRKPVKKRQKYDLKDIGDILGFYNT